ncbi:MAG TPA: FG-GAP-like repeat-containing protein [Myxococcales bacterium]|nr:FG-GAP-like repeat-containing protein [Myxococcales bacterium]
MARPLLSLAGMALHKTAPWIVGVVTLGTLLLPPRRARADGPTDPPDKGGTRPEAISLPSGPGSLQGLGESVSVVPATGAAQVAVPVVLPPGPPGVLPDLSLRYDSRQGEGELGMGWSIALPSVQRRTDHGLPRYLPSDELLWNGEPLVQLGPRSWRLRVEGEFTRVAAVGAGFRADRRDGTQIFLGESAASQVVQNGEVFRWAVDRVVDPEGDEADYAYQEDQGQLYLTSVQYGRHGEAPAQWAQVKLGYAARPDALLDEKPTYPVVTAQRLTSIESDVDGSLVRRVLLTYDPGPGLSRLASVTACGSDGTTCLPTLAFTSTAVDPSAPRLTLLPAPGFTLEDPNTALVDVDGDSLPDAVQLLTTGATLWRNLGPAGFGPPEPLAGAPGVNLSSTGVAFQDMDGDGRADLLMALGVDAQDGLAFFPAQGGGLGTPVEGVVPPSLPPDDPAVRWLDLNGDGLVDALRGDVGGWTMWLNEGGGNFGEPVTVPVPVPWLTFTDPQIRLADMNDDGLVDIVSVHSQDVEVLFSQGFGQFTAPVPMPGAPDVAGDDTRLYLGDADGDGLPDLYYVRPGAVSLWLNQANGSFGPEVDADAPDYDPVGTAIRFADMEGEGTRDVVYSSQVAAPFLALLSFAAGARPNLLASIDDGVGGRRSYQYQATGPLMAQAKAEAAPWASVIPFPMEAVTTLRSEDGRSVPEVVGRSYRDPYYDGVQRQFRGFGGATELHPGDDHARGLTLRRRYHVGRGEDQALAGQPLEEVAADDEGSVYRDTLFDVEARTAAVGLDGEPCVFPAEVSREVHEVEGGDDSPAVFRTRQELDSLGEVVERFEDGRIDLPGGDPEAGVWHYAYAKVPAGWRVGLLARQELDGADGSRLSVEERYYDGPAAEGLPLGDATKGDLSRRSVWVAADRFVDAERITRDAWGNAIVSLDADGRRREVDYDSARHEFPQEERRFPSPGVTLRFDFAIAPAFGQPLTFVDADGATTRYGYDPLGRLVSIQHPEDPDGDPSEIREYQLDTFPPALVDERRPEPGFPFSLQSADLYDGLFRKIAHVESAEDGSFAVSQLVTRDVHGDVDLETEPFFAPSLRALAPPAGTAATERFYDGLGRPLVENLPAGGSQRWAYGPSWIDFWDPVAASGAAWPMRRQLDLSQRTIEVDQDQAAGESVFRFERDALGRLTKRITAEGDTASVAYDGLGDLVDLADPDSGRTSWSYDGSGHALSRSDGRGDTLTWTYDGAGRLVTESDGNGLRAAYRYDVPGPGECGQPTPGRLLSVVDATGTSCFSYDAAGRLAGQELELGGFDLATGFAYDAADRLVAVTYPDGSALTYAYGGRGLVTGIPGLLQAASYDAAGRPLTRAFANGLDVTVARDPAGRTVGIQATEGVASVMALGYRLLPSGAPEAMTDDRGTTTYQLDGQERLTSETGPDGQRRQSYDAEGRLTGRWAMPDDPRLPGQGVGYGDGAGPHALTADAAGPYAYDAAGERTAGRGLALGYDAAGQLITASGAAFQASYGFAFDGQRRVRQVRWNDGHETSVFTFNPFVEVRDGVLWEHVLLGAERIASYAAGAPPARAATGVGCETGAGAGMPLWLLGLVLAVEVRARKLASRRRGVTLGVSSPPEDT